MNSDLLPPRVVLLLLLALSLPACPPVMAAPAKTRSPAPSFAVGVDLSMLDYLEARGVKYKIDGATRDPLKIFQSRGVNFVRLRLFVQPSGKDGQVNDLPYTLKLAKRVKKAGLKLLLDFHYSDGWCDPGSQATPAQWKDLSEAKLAERIHDYTADVIERFGAAKCMPDLVQTGNEVTNGMLWPTGAIPSDARWDVFAGLLKSAIQGARDGGYHGGIVIHVDRGGDWNFCEKFYENLDKRHVPYDVIGLSYYPFWQGPLAGLKTNLDNLSTHFQKDVMVVETGQNWRGEAKSGAPPTPEGQLAFLNSVFETVKATKGGRGAGVFYWAPEWIDGEKWRGPSWSAACESLALFDPDGEALPALDAFRKAAAP